MTGEDEEVLYIPPPKPMISDWLDAKTELAITGEEELLYIPLPLWAEFEIKVTLVIVGDEDWLNMPPPNE
jgi:hypothetical protein